jgi:hypothetical protein
VIVEVTSVPPGGDEKRRTPIRQEPPPEPLPRDIQAYRELSPVFGEMLEDFMVKIRFEAYCPIVQTRGLEHRRKGSAVPYLDILSVTDRDLDQHGYTIFENDEVMIEILRWRLGTHQRAANHGPFITRNLANQAKNLSLPVFHGGRGGYLLIRPSRPLFRRYFEGKTLENRGGKFPARFDQIGYHPDKGKAPR